ncbi:MAG TPA: DUF350 domain-containing protein [Chloroflexota bacterium]|nr:DUF350 domain-containing protein [Chloroflexota bacterium]
MVLNVEQLFFNLLLASLFSVLGFVLLYIGYLVLDALTPGHLSNKIFGEGNLAAAVLAGAFVIGTALIVAASIQG